MTRRLFLTLVGCAVSTAVARAKRMLPAQRIGNVIHDAHHHCR